jgi:hypothetical protein
MGEFMTIWIVYNETTEQNIKAFASISAACKYVAENDTEDALFVESLELVIIKES